jgi:cell division protein FtsI/penicillin-binding protein 2
VEAIVDGQGREAYHRDAEALRRLVSSKTARRLGQMMVLGTSEGSSRKTFGRRHKVLTGMDIASKTGSLNGKVDGETYHFTWYIGYAPASQPEIAVAVMVRNPISWVVKAGEVARETFTLYFMGINEKRDP